MNAMSKIFSGPMLVVAALIIAMMVNPAFSHDWDGDGYRGGYNHEYHGDRGNDFGGALAAALIGSVIYNTVASPSIVYQGYGYSDPYAPRPVYVQRYDPAYGPGYRGPVYYDSAYGPGYYAPPPVYYTHPSYRIREDEDDEYYDRH